MICVKCGRAMAETSEYTKLDAEKCICDDCAAGLEAIPDKCPVCGHASEFGESVAMLLTRATATPEERINAMSALVNVCENCGAIYMDAFQRELLKYMRQD